jgi:cystathionine beta-lyase
MTYDFTSIMERHGMDAIAVDALGKGGMAPEPPEEGFDAIPMWVADMNFPTAPSITDAIIERRRNGVTGLEPAHIGYENGVLGGVVSALKAFAQPGDAVLLHSPTYIGFTGSIGGNGYRIVLSPLVRDEAGVWRMDFDDMARKLEENHIHVAVFCSPHNPCGRVWERAEIERAMEVYREHDCVVISDEIWSDLVMPGHKHIPVQSVSDDARQRTVALYAPSKTFNLAGLIGSYHVIYSDYLRDRVLAVSEKTHYNSMNVLSMYALIGAYSKTGAEWLDELVQVLDGNIAWACGFIREHFEGVEVARPEGTYMLWLDCTEWCREHGRDIDWLERAGWRVGVDWQDGRAFHGPCHVRMNLALPLSRVQEAFTRLDRYVFNA